MPDARSLVAMQERLERAGLRTRREEGVECCYARQTKLWAHDPDGNLWEVYTFEGDIDHRGAGQAEEVVLGTAAAIGSKWTFRVPVEGGTRHVFNPSNFAISVTLLLFPWVGLLMPWQFTAVFDGIGDWAVPVIMLCLGGFINGVYNKRAALIVGFVLQLVVRIVVFRTPFLALIAPVTEPAAIIYMFFMLPGPTTTPERAWRQVAFGLAVGLAYLLLVALHIPFGLFFALTIGCAARGIGLWAMALAARRREILAEGIVSGS